MVTQIGAHLSGVNLIDPIEKDPAKNLDELNKDLKAYLDIISACHADIQNNGAISQAHLEQLASFLRNLQRVMGAMKNGTAFDQQIAEGSKFNALYSAIFEKVFVDKLPSQFEAANEGNLNDLNQLATFLFSDKDDVFHDFHYECLVTINSFLQNPLH